MSLKKKKEGELRMSPSSNFATMIIDWHVFTNFFAKKINGTLVH